MSKVKDIKNRRKSDLFNDPAKIYAEMLGLVEQAIHARYMADAMYFYRWNRIASTGLGNSLISFSYVALENFAIQQLSKLFDSQSALNIWDVVKNLPYPELKSWLEAEYKNIADDAELILEWRGTALAHRGEVVHYATTEYEKKFKNGRTSEQRLHKFLLEYLCKIKKSIYGTPTEETMEQLELGLSGFSVHVKKCVEEVLR